MFKLQKVQVQYKKQSCYVLCELRMQAKDKMLTAVRMLSAIFPPSSAILLVY